MDKPKKPERLDIRIDGPYKLALQKLKERNGEKTPVAMVRLLIRDAAKEAGVWEEIIERKRHRRSRTKEAGTPEGISSMAQEPVLETEIVVAQ